MAFAPVARRAVEIKVYKSAIFFENSAEQRAEIITRCPEAKVIKESLDEAPADTKFLIVDIPETEPPPTVDVKSLPFYDEFNEYVVRTKIKSETYDAVSGVQQNHIDNIIKPWIESRGEGPHVAIFDWDRTTSVIEGIRLRQDLSGAEFIEGDPTAYYVALLTHICGGDERLAEIQTMFRQLIDAGIHVMFLTNNPSGRYTMFDEMIQVLLDAKKPAYSIVVSHGSPYDGVKANVFSRLQEFSELACKKRPLILPPIGVSPPPKPVAFRSFAPIAPPTPYVPKYFSNGTENLYGVLEGGKRHRKTMRRRKTIRRMLRRMMRRSRRNTCGKTCRKLL